MPADDRKCAMKAPRHAPGLTTYRIQDAAMGDGVQVTICDTCAKPLRAVLAAGTALPRTRRVPPPGKAGWQAMLRWSPGSRPGHSEDRPE